jgi:hypothetical protein
MSSHADIRQVYREESKFKLKPHLVNPELEPAVIVRGSDGLLRVTMRELLSPAAYQTLKEMGLLQ